MDELDEQLRQLVAETCKHPVGSLSRQKGLNQIIRTIQQSGKLWRSGDANYYEDALQQTWMYFCRNLDKYDPQKGSIITWLNSYLKYRLLDFRQKTTEIDSEPLIPPESWSRIEKEILDWVKKDSGKELRRTHIRNHPEINCQVLILRRLPPRTAWKQLAKEFNVSVSTLSSFYQRQCFPRLLKFGKDQGYL